jgi:hypothetical protein
MGVPILTTDSQMSTFEEVTVAKTALCIDIDNYPGARRSTGLLAICE